MKLATNKTLSTIALILILTFSAIMASMSMANAAGQNIPTYAFLAVEPNPVGVGETLSITMWLDKIPPIPPTSAGVRRDVWSNLVITVTKPGGTTETLGPYTTDSVGTTWDTYIPNIVGNYTFQLSFPGQTALTGDYYQPSTSPNVVITVQQEPIPPYPSTPLPGPNDYWQRPINGGNKGWSTIAGNWLSSSNLGSFHTDSTAPKSAHIVWTRPIALGGIVGGQYGDATFYTGLSYEAKFKPPIIMQGRLYYNNPDYPKYGFYCVDLYTGQQIWWQNSTGKQLMLALGGATLGVLQNAYGNQSTQITNGELLNLVTANQAGVIPYLWSIGGVLGTTRCELYDPFTGNWILTLANASGGTIYYDGDGSILVYMLNGARGWLAMWNSTTALKQGFPDWPVYGDAWRPPEFHTLDWNVGIQWNVTIPHVIGAEWEAIAAITPDYILANTLPNAGMGPSNSLPISNNQTEVCYDRKTGAQLWVQNRTLPTGSTAYGLMGPAADGVYTEFIDSAMTWSGYSLATGEKLWGPTKPYTNAWGMYISYGSTGHGLIAYGKLYAVAYDGMVHCYNLTTGQNLWNFYDGSSGIETPYGQNPFGYGSYCTADGMVFAANAEHSPQAALYRGYKLYAIDAETGNKVWSILGWFTSPAIADGYFVSYNAYDNQIYCFGKGPSATTVEAPMTTVTAGSSVVIRGTVTDISAGTKQQAQAAIFPNGVPAVSDASQEAWMEYVYEQQAMPANATGVEVTIDAVDPNGNFINIGTATSDISGNFGYAWTTPDVPGKYTIIATYHGSASYGSSYAETYAFVSEAPAATPTPTPLALPPTETYFAVSTIAIIIAIAIVGILLLRKRP